MGALFSKSEDELIKEMTKRRYTQKEIAEALNRPVRSIESRVRHLGIQTRINYHQWTEEETQIIIDNIDKDYKELMELLPHRSYFSIASKKTHLGRKGLGEKVVQERTTVC